MKKILNTPEALVLEMCNGFISAHPNIAFIEKYKILKKKTLNPNKVTLISGGGSGHEPAHGGFIGDGFLDAAVCGDVFASPSQIQVYKSILETANKKGTLLIIKNYSGDIMNFKNAANLAAEDGLLVDYVKVDDDIAVKDSLYTVGHRGVAGTIFVHKIAGAAAESGLDLLAVKNIAQKTIANTKSIGFALSSCTVPSKGSPTFQLESHEIEYGVGIHGEPGIRREAITTSDDLAKKMVSSLLNELELSSTSKETVAILVNGFGGTPLQELYVFADSVMKKISETSLITCKLLVGNYMTSLDMEGASLSILKVDKELQHYLLAKGSAPALQFAGNEPPVKYVPLRSISNPKTTASYILETPSSYKIIVDEMFSLNNMFYLIDYMSELIIENEIYFCELDSHAGDGDFGMSIAKGFRQLKREWKDIIATSDTIGSFLEACSLVIMEYCGGASGPIWGSAFRSAGKAVAHKKALTLSDFASMMLASVVGIKQTGERSFGRGAAVGDKTLIDALDPCANTWLFASHSNSRFSSAFTNAANAAVLGAKSTEHIVARMGRAGTVGERSLGFPDAGAFALGILFTKIATRMNE